MHQVPGMHDEIMDTQYMAAFNGAQGVMHEGLVARKRLSHRRMRLHKGDADIVCMGFQIPKIFFPVCAVYARSSCIVCSKIIVGVFEARLADMIDAFLLRKRIGGKIAGGSCKLHVKCLRKRCV